MRWTLTLLCMATLANAEDWPRFRGPNGSGVSDATGLPTEFGPKQNLVWRVAVPMGRSSPIVVKDRIYLTALEDNKLVTLAIDRQTGSSIWRREIIRDHLNKIFVGNDTASPTASSDGENLYTFFPDLGWYRSMHREKNAGAYGSGRSITSTESRRRLWCTVTRSP